MKKLVALLLVAAMAASMFAMTASADGGKLYLGMWPEETQTDAIAAHTDHYVPAFNAKHPDVEVVPAYYNYSPDTYVAMATAGNAPTVFESWYTEPEKLIRNGLVRDITGLPEGWSRLAFRFCVRGKWYRAVLTQEKGVIEEIN